MLTELISSWKLRRKCLSLYIKIYERIWETLSSRKLRPTCYESSAVCANVRPRVCGTYMHICASKCPIDSARWPLHFNNSHVDGLRFIYEVYFVFVDRWLPILVAVYVMWHMKIIMIYLQYQKLEIKWNFFKRVS